jgi:selenide,water dikinase
MGGKPLTALSIIGFPIDDLDGSIMEAILRGGIEKLQEANCALIGGHSLQDEEIKCGFAITGILDASSFVVRDNAQPGDVLVITKPLGTGILSFASQIGRLNASSMQQASEAMATLNKDAAELMVEFQAHACTDITGFGLMGHLVEMARNSRVIVELDMSKLPIFAAVRNCIQEGILPGSIERNQEYSMAWAKILHPGDEKDLPLLYDAQTSGGLLVALPKTQAQRYVDAMHARGHAATSIVGRIVEKAPGPKEGEVWISQTKLENWIGSLNENAVLPNSNKSAKKIQSNLEQSIMNPVNPCCADALASASNSVRSEPVLAEKQDETTAALYARFSEITNEAGLIDKRAKKLMAVALSVAQKCEPCLVAHLKGAMAMNISRAELDEAAWMGVLFGGSPALVFYRATSREVFK